VFVAGVCLLAATFVLTLDVFLDIDSSLRGQGPYLRTVNSAQETGDRGLGRASPRPSPLPAGEAATRGRQNAVANRPGGGDSTGGPPESPTLQMLAAVFAKFAALFVMGFCASLLATQGTRLSAAHRTQPPPQG